VYYLGDEADWNSISIDANNDFVKNATIHYNYIPPMAGDVNVDGQVSVTDVICLLKSIVDSSELTEQQFTNAEVSGDGKLTILDAILIQKLVLEML
jgi:hypothetical protein